MGASGIMGDLGSLRRSRASSDTSCCSPFSNVIVYVGRLHATLCFEMFSSARRSDSSAEVAAAPKYELFLRPLPHCMPLGFKTASHLYLLQCRWCANGCIEVAGLCMVLGRGCAAGLTNAWR